ncbi:MAG TPA: FtsX-like permease family protein [Chryseosolibacter sp.]
MIILVMAWRNIWRNKVRSAIIMCSVAIGLVAGLFVLSLYKGILEDRVSTVIHTEVSHIQLHHPKFKEDYEAKFVVARTDSVLSKLRGVPGIKSISARTVSQGMLMTGTGSTGLQIIGVDLANEKLVSQLDSKIIEGAGFGGKRKNQIIIGKKLADKMHLQRGNKAVLTFIDPESNIVSAAFRIVGIYRTDNAPRDERLVYVQRDDLNSLLAIGASAHEIAIILDDVNSVEATASSIKALFENMQVETWSEISPETKLMIDTTDSYSNIFIMIIMLALSFGIINTMLMAVLERSREIGMLLAVGMNRAKIFSMILTETIFLTLTGTPLGILITWLIVQIYQTKGIDISSIGGMTMSEFGFSSMIYPAFPWEKMPNELMIVTGAALFSALIPAIKAIRLKPVEALQK